ncbi:MAG TPA: Hsp20/alpha crystallin family protein [Caldilineae bacterium]|nr:Hsp20/alpha crystallin family protein [Caldilineae bacterium]
MMTQLMQWDPFREMAAWRSAMDRMFEESLAWPVGFGPQPQGYSLALDVLEKPEEFVIETAIPGIDPNELDISLSDNVLTIKGETKAEKDMEDARYHLRERLFGNFARSVSLPAPVDVDAVEATYENGVLRLNIPKTEEAKPHKITVHSSHVIEGESDTIS